MKTLAYLCDFNLACKNKDCRRGTKNHKTWYKTFDSSQEIKNSKVVRSICTDFRKEFMFGLNSADGDDAACLAQQSSLPQANQLAVWMVVRYLRGLSWPRCWPCLPDAPFPQVSALQLAAWGSSKPTGPQPETCWMMPEPENCTDKHVFMHHIEPTHWTRRTMSTDKQPQTAHFMPSDSQMASCNEFRWRQSSSQ